MLDPDENGYLIFCKFIVIFSRFCIYSKMEGDEEREATIQTKQALVLMCVRSSAIGYTTPPAVLFISHLLEIYSSHLSLSDALSQVVAEYIHSGVTFLIVPDHRLMPGHEPRNRGCPTTPSHLSLDTASAWPLLLALLFAILREWISHNQIYSVTFPNKSIFVERPWMTNV